MMTDPPRNQRSTDDSRSNFSASGNHYERSWFYLFFMLICCFFIFIFNGIWLFYLFIYYLCWFNGCNSLVAYTGYSSGETPCFAMTLEATWHELPSRVAGVTWRSTVCCRHHFFFFFPSFLSLIIKVQSCTLILLSFKILFLFFLLLIFLIGFFVEFTLFFSLISLFNSKF
jgi:hypothetical protein